MRTRGMSPVTTWGDETGEGGVCVTSMAVYGRCMSFKKCYPYVKKVPNLSIFDTWVLGNYDTCTYLTKDGRQAVGVCCDDPTKPIAISNDETSSSIGNDLIIENKETYLSNWPPPIPTHPPDHTAATHPTAWQTQAPTRWTNRPTVVTTTSKKPSQVWPPPIPTHPPSQGVPVTVSDMAVGNYCGSKNGNQDQERIVGGQNAAPNEWPWIAVLLNAGF